MTSRYEAREQVVPSLCWHAAVACAERPHLHLICTRVSIFHATVRVRDVEQVFCSQGGGIAFADLSQSSPGFGIVSQAEVQTLNRVVGAMIR